MSLNPNDRITITNREKWELERKAKQGWKAFFIERDYVGQLRETRDKLYDTVRILRGDGGVDYEFLKQQFLELYDKVGERCDCPVCFDPLLKENTAIPLCGHLVCKNCKSSMTLCPICRKAYCRGGRVEE